MSLSKVIIVANSSKTRGGFQQYDVVSLAGAPVPATMELINQGLVDSARFPIGKPFNVNFRRLTDEFIVRDGVVTGDTRERWKMIVIGESDFVNDTMNVMAEEQAKAQAVAALAPTTRNFAARINTRFRNSGAGATPNPADAILTPLNAELNRIEDMDTPVPAEIEALVAKARVDLAAYPVELAAFLAKAKDAVGATV